MVQQAFLIIRSKSHEASLPYPEKNERTRWPDLLQFCEHAVEEGLHVVILTKPQGQSLLPYNVFAVV